MNPTLRRRINAIGLFTERANLERLIVAIGTAAVRAYAGEAIADSYDHVERLAARYIRDAADRGAFRYFGVRDAADLVAIPTMLFPGWPVGTIGVRAHDVASMICDRGTRGRWVEPQDLEFSGTAR